MGSQVYSMSNRFLFDVSDEFNAAAVRERRPVVAQWSVTTAPGAAPNTRTTNSSIVCTAGFRRTRTPKKSQTARKLWPNAPRRAAFVAPRRHHGNSFAGAPLPRKTVVTLHSRLVSNSPREG